MRLSVRGVGVGGLLAGCVVLISTRSVTLARRYINTVTAHPLAIWMLDQPTEFYLENLDHGPNSRQPGITRHLIGIYPGDPGGDESDVSDPSQPSLRYLQVSHPLRVFHLQEMLLHVPTGTPIATAWSAHDGRTLGLSAGDWERNRVRAKARDVFRQRIPRAPEGFTWIPIPQSVSPSQWFTQTLPALIRGVRCCEENDLLPPGLIDPGGLPAWALESITPLKAFQWTPTEPLVECGQLLLVGQRGSRAVSHADMLLVRDLLLPAQVEEEAPEALVSLGSPAGTAVLVRGGDSGPRSALFDDAASAAEQCGATLVDTTSLSLGDLIRRMSRARVLMGTHPDDLVHAAWMGQGSSVVELRLTDRFDLRTVTLCQALRMEYEYVDLRPDRSGQPDDLAALIRRLGGGGEEP